MATASADTLDVAGDGAVEMTVSRPGYVTSHTTGAVHARQAMSGTSKNTLKRELRSWVLNYTYRSATELASLRAIWANSKGGAALLDWTPPDEGSAIQVRISDGGWRETYDGSLYSITLRIEEVL